MKHTWWMRATMSAVAVISAVGVGSIGSGTAHAAPDGRCIVSQTSARVTIDSLNDHCTSQQIVDLFAAAPLGHRPPTGKYRLHLLPDHCECGHRRSGYESTVQTARIGVRPRPASRTVTG